MWGKEISSSILNVLFFKLCYISLIDRLLVSIYQKACVRTLTQKLKEYSELVDQLLAQDKEREALQIFIDVLRVSIQSSQNLLAEEKEQIQNLKVYVSNFHGGFFLSNFI